MRLYTGLESSLTSGVWQPEGVPTVYNFLNRASDQYDIDLVLTCKDSGQTYTSNWHEPADKQTLIKGLDANVTVLAGTNYFPSFIPRKWKMIFRDIRHLYQIIRIKLQKKPHLIYCDGANVTFAFCLTKLFPKTPIVLRLLGICSFLRSLPTTKRPIHLIYKAAFRAKFKMVIGTQDGTGTEFFLDKILEPAVTRKVLLNGTDSGSLRPKVLALLPSKWSKKEKHLPIVLFVGRLEEDKGIRIFIRAISESLTQNEKKFRALVIGNGSLLDEMQKLVKQAGISDHVHFTGSVPHKMISQYQLISDIYVSTNKDGNLTNANLEAIASDACMIIPAPQFDKLIDVKTFEYLSKCVLFFECENSKDLKEKILNLVDNPNQRKILSERLAYRKLSFMRSWDSRVSEELKLISSLIS